MAQTTEWWSEIPDRSQPRIWCFSDRMTYERGDRVNLHMSGTCADYTVKVTRFGASTHVLYSGSFDNCRWSDVPANAYEIGCDWPVLCSFVIPADTPAGAYIIELQGDGCPYPYHHLVFVRSSATEDMSGRLLLVAATNTYVAYNNWGGASHYGGLGEDSAIAAPVVSTRRPWTRGTICLPPDAPRIPDFRPKHGDPIRYPHIEWAKANGYGRTYASAGWAQYEGHFVSWAEKNGLTVDVVCQETLHDDPSCLDRYPCAVFVGHDEYWTWELRDAVDAYVEAGGNVARFAGNFMWQSRRDAASHQQTTYKYDARSLDPLFGSDQQRFTTTVWEAREVARPGAMTFGVNATRGMYAGWGGLVAHGPRAFTVYLEDHWTLTGSGLGYGDLLGADGLCFGYEVDGLDYIIEDGLPRPSGKEQVPDGLVIIALGLATSIERGGPDDKLNIGDLDAVFLNDLYTELFGEAAGAAAIRGSGAMVEFIRGAGRVVTIGSCEWISGLRGTDPAVETVTANILSGMLRGIVNDKSPAPAAA